MSGRSRALPWEIARKIEAGIVRGQWERGARLPTEAELAAKHGASRAVVREALQMLKARGLVSSRRGSGNFVAADAGAAPVQTSLELYAALRNDARSFLELLDLRLLVETFCVRQLAAPGAAVQRAALRERVARMEAAREDLGSFGREDIAFHVDLVEGTGHHLFANLFRGLMPDVGERFARETYLDTTQVEKILGDHRAICRALDIGDADGAERRLRRHIIDSRVHLEALLQSAEDLAAGPAAALR